MVKVKKKTTFKIPQLKESSRKERLMKQVETNTTTFERDEQSEFDAIEYTRKRPPPKLTPHDKIFD
jgi:hypothetical protein